MHSPKGLTWLRFSGLIGLLLLLLGSLGGCATARVYLRGTSGWVLEARDDDDDADGTAWYETSVWNYLEFPRLNPQSDFERLHLQRGRWRGPNGQKALAPTLPTYDDREVAAYYFVYATGKARERRWFAKFLADPEAQELRCPPSHGGGAPLWVKIGRVHGSPPRLLVSCKSERWIPYVLDGTRLVASDEEVEIAGPPSLARRLKAQDEARREAEAKAWQRKQAERTAATDPYLSAGSYCVVWLYKTDKTVGLADSAWQHQHWILLADVQLERGGRMSELLPALDRKVRDKLPIHRDFYLVRSGLPAPNVWGAWSIATSRCDGAGSDHVGYLSRIAVRL